MKNLFRIFQKAQKEHYAIGQFNASNLEQIKAIVSASQKLRAPVIIGTSEGESSFIGLKQIEALVRSYREETGLPIFLNFDHGHSLEKIKEAIEAGYEMVHFDGSGLPCEENVRQTKKVVEYVKKCQMLKVKSQKLLVEGELGYLRGSSALHKEAAEIKEDDLTKPDEALKFIEETDVDSLAVVIGNIHGIYAQMPKLNLERLKEIKEKIGPNGPRPRPIGEKVFLVLHGGSGIPDEEIKKAIELGIIKINVNTELRAAWTQALKKSLTEQPEEIVPYKIMPLVVEAVQKIVEEKIKLFGSENKI